MLRTISPDARRLHEGSGEWDFDWKISKTQFKIKFFLIIRTYRLLKIKWILKRTHGRNVLSLLLLRSLKTINVFKTAMDTNGIKTVDMKSMKIMYLANIFASFFGKQLYPPFPDSS